MDQFLATTTIVLTMAFQPPVSIESDDGQIAQKSRAGEASAEFIEIIYQGQTTRVPLDSSGSNEVQIDNSQLRIQILSDGGSDSTINNAGSSFESNALPPTSGAETTEPDGFTLSRDAMIMGIVLGVTLLGILVYFLVIDPMRRRRGLEEAQLIIQEDRRPQFDRAEELLDQSLLAGMRKKDIVKARFLLAYLRTTMGRHEEAATVLGDLEKSQAKIDQPTAFLMLYVNAKLQNYERVERIYLAHQPDFSGDEQPELIVSIAFLNLARLRWARREINGAMYYFDEVRKLKHLTSEIPGHIDDHEVVIGVSALFEKNIEEAEKHFEAAVREGETRNKPTHTGRIGLCLCRWQSGEILEVDEELSTILKEMEPDEDHSEQSPVETECPHCGKDYRVKRRYLGQHVKCKSCRRRFEVLEGQSEKQDQESPEDQDETATLSDDEQILSDSDLLLRNVRLWHSMVCVARWQSLPELSGLPDDQRESLQKRLDGVKQIDPSIGDPYLISGLIQYYFAKTDEERTAGKEQIESSIDKDVHLPEVLQLIDRENKLASLSEHSLSYFHQLARKYVENAEVDVQLRERFARKMNRFQRFRTLGEVSGESEEAAVPSLENLKGRGQILSTRVSNILQYRQDETSDELKEQIGERLDNMQQQTQSLSETAQALQKTEFELMEHTGEFLFQDENPAGDQVD